MVCAYGQQLPDGQCHFGHCRLLCLRASLQVKPIIVADMLSTAHARSSLADITGMTAAVQGFLNNVVAAAGYGAMPETTEQLKQSVAAAIIGPRASMELPDSVAAAAAAAGPGGALASGSDVVTSDEDEEDEKNTFNLARAGGTDVSGAPVGQAAAAVAPADAGAAGTNGTAQLANGAAAPGSNGAVEVGGGSSSSQPSKELGRTASFGAAAGAGQGRALLLKDAFLVFRALCKLSIRTSDTVTVSDPTAVRGKVRFLCGFLG